MDYTISIICNGLLDQGRYIGKDPVGHACHNDASYVSPEGFPLCIRCSELYKNNDTKLTLMYPPFGVEEQKEAVKKMMETFLKHENNS